MSATVYKERGGVWLGEYTIFGVTLPVYFASVSATWPFGRLELRDDTVRVNAGAGLWPLGFLSPRITLRFNDIHSVELYHGLFWRIIWFGAQGIRIHHAQRGPRFVVFFTYRPARILGHFEEIGVRILR